MSQILRAVAIHGGRKRAFAESLGITPQMLNHWLARKRVPAEYCIAVEKATQGIVTRYDLRPEVFGDKPEQHG